MQNGRMHTYRLFPPNRQVVEEAPTEVQDRKQNVIGASKNGGFYLCGLIFGAFTFLFFGPNYRGDKKRAKEDVFLLLLLSNHEDLIAGIAVTIRDSSHNHGTESLRMTRIREDGNVIVSHPVMQEREREREHGIGIALVFFVKEKRACSRDSYDLEIQAF